MVVMPLLDISTYEWLCGIDDGSFTHGPSSKTIWRSFTK